MNRFLVAAFVAALFLSCKNEAPNAAQNSETSVGKSAQTTSTARKTILFFGNSLTAAYGLKPEEGFPAQIQRRLDSLHLDFKVVEAGVSGNTTADGRSRIDWVLSQNIDIFILELGGNDALRGLPVDSAKLNLQFIIDKVKTKFPQAKIVLAGMQAPPNLGKTYATAFRKMYPDLAAANGCALIPFLLEGVGGEANLNQKDGIHPTATGDKIVAETIWKVLGPLVLPTN